VDLRGARAHGLRHRGRPAWRDSADALEPDRRAPRADASRPPPPAQGRLGSGRVHESRSETARRPHRRDERGPAAVDFAAGARRRGDLAEAIHDGGAALRDPALRPAGKGAPLYPAVTVATKSVSELTRASGFSMGGAPPRSMK